MEEKKQKNKKLKGLIKLLNIKSLMILILLLIVNSFAWFIYATRSSLSMNVHVDSWNISFEDGDQSANLEIYVEHAYPGMTTYSKTYTIVNNGEQAAVIGFTIVSARILDTTYVSGEGGVTSNSIKTMLENDFPFTITIDTSAIATGVLGQDETGIITVSMTWPYESGNDELDTKWGMDAYSYYQNHAGDDLNVAAENTAAGGDSGQYPIYINIKLTATQSAP